MRLGRHDQRSRIRCGCAVHPGRAGSNSSGGVDSCGITARLRASVAVHKFLRCITGQSLVCYPLRIGSSGRIPQEPAAVGLLRGGRDLAVGVLRISGRGQRFGRGARRNPLAMA